MATILTTTGISLYTNTKRAIGGEQPTDDDMRQHLRLNPNQASAEANSLLQISKDNDHLILLHTEQTEAVRCARLLEEYFRNRGGYQQVRLVPLTFQSDPKQIETTGLRDLINAFISEIEKAQRDGREVIINATAGFKAQIVYSTMIGMIYQVPIQYLYEDFRTVVTFNPIAIEWDTSLFLANESFFHWIDTQPRTYQDVERFLIDYPDREQIIAFLTPPDPNGEVFLSYIGNALYRRFQGEKEKAKQFDWPPPSVIQNPAEKIFAGKHHKVKGEKGACEKIAEIDCIKKIEGEHFEDTTRTAIKRVYDDGKILLLWADNTQARRFLIYTTAQGEEQTLLVAQRIKEILEID